MRSRKTPPFGVDVSPFMVQAQGEWVQLQLLVELPAGAYA